MSNYPPGVSGNEWQIIGPVVLVLSRDCDECGWSGQTDAEYYDFTLSWTCPNGHEHNEVEEMDEGSYFDPYDPERWGADRW